MRIAMPLHKELSFYHDNPLTAPKIAIYSIKREKNDTSVSLSTICANPWFEAQQGNFADEQILCRCDEHKCAEIGHIIEHYALLDLLEDCDYLLADHYCSNTFRALKNGGVAIYKIAPIIHSAEKAIRNFIIGASIASNIQHIHYAS